MIKSLIMRLAPRARLWQGTPVGMLASICVRLVTCAPNEVRGSRRAVGV